MYILLKIRSKSAGKESLSLNDQPKEGAFLRFTHPCAKSPDTF